MPGKRKLTRGTPARALGQKRQKKTEASPVIKQRGARVPLPPHVMADRQATETEFSPAESSGNESEVEDCTFPQISHDTTVKNFRISQNTIDFTPTQQTSIHDTVGEHVPHKIKKKIWDGTFIELSTLLKSQREMEETEGDLKCKKGRLCIEKRSSGVELSINDWTSAFMVYMSVYIEKYRTRAQELLKYMRDIRLAASRSENWAVYDEQFRLKIEKNPNLSWGNIHGEYWLLHVNSPSTSGQHSYQTGQQQTYVPRIYTQNKMQLSSNQVNPQNNIKPRANQQSVNASMYCRYYNNGTDCPYFPRCRFKHVCELCEGRHRRAHCNKATGRGLRK